MPHRNPQLQSWLAAERDGQELDAERALSGLFALLPQPRLSPLFADQVLASLVPARVVRWPLGRWMSALLALTAAALWIAPWWLSQLVALLPAVDWQGLMLGIWRGLVGSAVLMTTVLARLDELSRLAVLILSRPPALAALAVCGLVALASGRLLYDLLHERSSEYA